MLDGGWEQFPGCASSIGCFVMLCVFNMFTLLVLLWKYPKMCVFQRVLQDDQINIWPFANAPRRLLEDSWWCNTMIARSFSTNHMKPRFWCWSSLCWRIAIHVSSYPFFVETTYAVYNLHFLQLEHGFSGLIRKQLVGCRSLACWIVSLRTKTHSYEVRCTLFILSHLQRIGPTSENYQLYSNSTEQLDAWKRILLFLLRTCYFPEALISVLGGGVLDYLKIWISMKHILENTKMHESNKN